MNEVVILNGSPRMNLGNTGRVLAPFIDGIEATGANVTQFFTSKLDIKPCNCGIMYCWNKNPGICIHQDDMVKVLDAIRKAEIIVFATPVYIPLPGAFQEAINRLCPLLEPVLIFKNGRTRAKLREDVRIQKFVLVGVSGWWELENLDVVVHIINELAENSNVAFSGAILRPHANVLEFTGADVLAYIKQAGSNLIQNGSMEPELLQKISRPLIEREKYQKYF